MDISELLRPLVDHAGPPPSLDRLQARVKHRRRGRVVAVASVVVLVAVAGAGLAVRPDHTPTKVVTSSEPAPAPSTTTGSVPAPAPSTAPSTVPSAPLPSVAPPNRIALTRASPQFGPGLLTAEIVLVNEDGTDAVPLTHAASRGLVASQPAFSPDRRRLAYIESTPTGAINAGTGNIVIVNADSTNPVQLTATAGDTHPVWAPDGHHLAFARFDNGLPDLFVISDDGTGLRQVTRGGAMSPTWSPDGTLLAYRNLPNGSIDGGHIFIVKPDGTRARQLTNGSEEGDPAWAPDGSRIAFVSTQDSSIYTVRFDGTDLKRVTTCSPPSCSTDTAPAWSPDATRLVFDRSLGNRRQPFIVSSTGGDPHALLTDTDDHCCAAWS